MKIKLKDKGVKLPNIWKSCGASSEDWQGLHDGKEIEVKAVPEIIETFFGLLSDFKNSPTRSIFFSPTTI